MAIILDGSTGISSIGTLTGVTSISSDAANTPVVMQDSGSNSNTVSAWVNFNGTGTVAIRASFNVTSITDNGTGVYTVNFTTALVDANYAASVSARTVSGSNVTGVAAECASPFGTAVRTTTALKIVVMDSVSAAVDSDSVSVTIFR
jgi:hypothetical protein